MTRWLGALVTRIFWLHLATITVATLAMVASIYILLNATLSSFEHHTLEDHAAAIAQAIRPDGQALNLDLPPQLRELYAEGYGGYEFAVTDAAGKPVFSSLKSGKALFPQDKRKTRASYFERPRGRSAFYGASYPQVVGDQSIWVQVRQNLENPDVFVDDVVAQFLGRIGWLIVPIVLLLLAADIFIVQRALRPVREASRRAEAINSATIDVRLPIQGLPKEVQPLVLAVNSALDRLEAGFRVQRQFTADAAHELRTPLTVLRLRADGLAHKDEDAAQQFRADVDAMGRLVDQLLAMAELETFTLPLTDRADLRAVGIEVASFMAPVAIAAQKELELSVGDQPVSVKGNPELLFRALRNLVENAIAHTPPKGSVTIAIEPAGVVMVTDQGPGVSDDERPLIFGRFWRRDRTATKGSGLGLSIVAQIVATHGGSIEVETAPAGGARFVMSLVRSL